MNTIIKKLNTKVLHPCYVPERIPRTVSLTYDLLFGEDINRVKDRLRSLWIYSFILEEMI